MGEWSCAAMVTNGEYRFFAYRQLAVIGFLAASLRMTSSRRQGAPLVRPGVSYRDHCAYH
jgi:hypothetical protein